MCASQNRNGPSSCWLPEVQKASSHGPTTSGNLPFSHQTATPKKRRGFPPKNPSDVPPRPSDEKRGPGRCGHQSGEAQRLRGPQQHGAPSMRFDSSGKWQPLKALREVLPCACPLARLRYNNKMSTHVLITVKMSNVSVSYTKH